MAMAREHFALDWIKADLLETLNDARVALDDFAELSGDETRMRACLTGLHQVHGTLVMLELKGVTQLADHLEQLAQAMLAKQISDEAAAGQTLMQGILELPGYLDELQRGAEDSVSTSMALVNEIRGFLKLEKLIDPAGGSLRDGASDETIARFNSIGGPEKVARMRSAYQNVLLSILKGEDRSAAVSVLGKISIGLEKVTEGAPLERQWQAFGEFVASLEQTTGVLESEAVKLLRRVDVEIKMLAKDGEATLRRPVNMELVQQLLDGAVARNNTSAAVVGLQEAVARDASNNTLAISGRQALGSAAEALQDDLAVIKDKLDLLVRTNAVDLDELRQLITPLKQIGSTLSLLGFESSREIVSDQVDAIENLVVLGDGDPQGVQSIASALMQIDENLSSVILGSGQTEVEQITSDAQLQVLSEARKDLDHIKQCIVDFVTAHWSVGHLESVPGKLSEIAGVLEIIPLTKAISMLGRVRGYVESRLMQGHRPEWQELDQFADVISAIDYYLERLAGENSAGSDDILVVADRNLSELEGPMEAAVEAVVEAVVEAPSNVVPLSPQPPVEELVEDVVEQQDEQIAEPSDVSEEVADASAGSATQDAADQIDYDAGSVSDETVDAENLAEIEEPKLELEEDPGFDLSSDVFANLEGAIDAEDAAPEVEEIQAGEHEEQTEQIEEIEVSGDLEVVAEDPVPAQPPADPEIVEIFVEEVDEVLATIREYLPQWSKTFEPGDALDEVRRGFHTLKGSGRIVQAEAIGELGWGVENMLNRVIDTTVTANPQFVSVIESACDLVPSLIESFKHGRAADTDALTAIIDQADILSSGGEIELSSASGPVAVEEPIPAAEVPEDLAEESLEQLNVSEFDLDGLDFSDVSDEVAPADEIAAPADSVEPSTNDLFVVEAREHLAIIQAENEQAHWLLSEPIARAFHTLAGGAALAELAQVQLIVEPAYQIVEAFRNADTSDELKAFFVAAADHLDGCLSALENNQPWEEPLEFVAQADDLLASKETAPRAVNQLLDAPATSILFDAEKELSEFLNSDADRSSASNLQTALLEISSLAENLNAEPITDLASGLAQALSRTPPSGTLRAENVSVMDRAYHQVIEQLNAVAAGGGLAPQDELVAALQTLDFSPEQDDDEVAVAAEQQPSRQEVEPAVEDSPADQSVMAELAEIDPDLVQVFFEEADEINEELEASMLQWADERDNRLYMENILRGLHTLKGGARLCGLTSLGDLAHNFESVVIEVQSNERPINDALFTELNRRYDEITGCVSQLSADLDDSNAEAVSAVAESPAAEDDRRDSTAAVRDAADRDAAISDINKVVEAAAAPVAPTPIREAASETELPPSIVPDEKAAKAAPAERSSQEMVRVGSSLLEELVNLAGESSILRARIEQGMSDFTGALDEMETTIERLREQLRRLEIETETQILHRHERSDGPQYENFDPLEMDRYNQMQQLSRSLTESASDMLDLKETLLFKARESETLLLQQARINTELQEGLMRTRMVPFSRLLPRLRRTVRQVAGELGKEIDFNVQNAEGELDRNLLERMVPPLEHMLRNAVDHGIENVEMRRNFGKAAKGRIDLRLTREGGDVVIEISDDGAGIDVEGVRAKAIERGLMSADADLTDDEALQFVLAAGFSTAKSVTQISGRGVGLDVVHSEVKQLGGSVNIVSRPGKGTRFVLRVPFTVSVNRALMVSVSEDLYAIPLNTIEGIVLLSPEQLQTLYDGEGKTFEYAGVPYRVRYLGQYLGREYHGSGAGQGSIPMVLVRSGDHAVAIHVDHVQGSREIVVKSLGPQFAGVGGISGATILGDGSVVVILDLLALIRAQHHEGARRTGQSFNARSGPRCIMVVDDSVTVRKVTSRLLERQGMDVVVAKDGIEAVAMLQERRPDVMLLDIEMPRMDGFEVARQVRHDDRLNSLPIVMISSRTGDKHKEHASQLGVNKFLGKPFQENELLATIDELVPRS